MDLSSLSPEEISTLKTALEQHESVAPSDGHADIEEDRSFLEPIIQAIELITAHLEAQQEKLEFLEKIVMDDIIGGVKGLYNGQMRTQSIGSIKSKYAGMFDPLEAAWKDEGDIYEKLYDVIEELKEAGNYSEESEGSSVKNIADMLQKKVDDNTSTSNEPKIEIEASGTPDKLQEMLSRIKQQKEKSKGLSIF